MVKSYANVGDTIREAIAQYVNEVKTRAFPEEKHSFTSQKAADPAQSEMGKLYGGERK